MKRNYHEVRDPIHGFIQYDDDERALIDSIPVQRLRDIHQLSLEFMVYPGATHKRFEHSLGVMHLASRIFDSLFDNDNLDYRVREVLHRELDNGRLGYWKRVVRLAALLHDIGHPPFSHTGEELLPDAKNHEHFTEELIKSAYISKFLEDGTPPVKPDAVFKCSVDFKKRTEIRLTPWETVLNEIITGDVFGADRMDYLLRDSYYTGVAYGRFDLDRLVSCLRIVIDDREQEGTGDIVLGITAGGMHAAESLLLARYFMYEQVYFHPVRCIYDIHLTDYIKKLRKGSRYPENLEDYLRLSDSEVIHAIRQDLLTGNGELHELAKRILNRDHFRKKYSLSKTDFENNPKIWDELVEAMDGEQGLSSAEFRRFRRPSKDSDIINFLVLVGDDVRAAQSESSIIKNLPRVNIGYIYASAKVAKQVCGIIEGVRRGDGKNLGAQGDGNGLPRSEGDPGIGQEPEGA